jgi:nucleoside-diphosphate-sugar epimerase
MILVTGGSGYVGRFLLKRLAQQPERVCCLLRPGRERGAIEQLGFDTVAGDLEQPEALASIFAEADAIVHLVHIRYAPAVLHYAGNDVKRIVLLSSLRRFSRVSSPSVLEVGEAERAVLDSPKPWVLLRPAMIYGPGDDRNISRLRAHLRRWRFQPVFGDGLSLQQPVYVEDVVDAILAALVRPAIEGRAYALAGACAMTYRELIGAVGDSAGIVPRIVRLPVRPCVWALRLLRRCGLPSGIEPEQILRLQEDKAFSIEEARRDLGYDPLDLQRGLAQVEAWTQ